MGGKFGSGSGNSYYGGNWQLEENMVDNNKAPNKQQRKGWQQKAENIPGKKCSVVHERDGNELEQLGMRCNCMGGHTFTTLGVVPLHCC